MLIFLKFLDGIFFTFPFLKLVAEAIQLLDELIRIFHNFM